jgi:hypothetical protein
MCGPLCVKTQTPKLTPKVNKVVVSINKVAKCHQSFQEFKNVNLTI